MLEGAVRSPTRIFGAFLMVVWVCAFAYAASRSMFGHASVSWALIFMAACATRFLVSGQPPRLMKAVRISGTVAIAGFLIFMTVITIEGPVFEENSPGIMVVVYAVYLGGPLLLASLILALVPFEEIWQLATK